MDHDSTAADWTASQLERVRDDPAGRMALLTRTYRGPVQGAPQHLVRDVVLTPQEIEGLMAGLLVSHDPPLGEIRFSEWLAENAASIGRRYANELQRHFATGAR